jgi:hypothetical protein
MRIFARQVPTQDEFARSVLVVRAPDGAALSESLF